MNTPPDLCNTNEVHTIPEFETLYQQALTNGEQFHVLKDIRDAIRKLKITVQNKMPLVVEKIIITKQV